ncbi:MAG TPA: FAD-dependent thymidylate synthase [Acidobacteriaceae bacterium]|nr:FAD-dependent thymidylate synthase [Acidobacteriaceae bacterium]
MSERPKENPAANTTEVYAIHGAEPEVLAYAMAKYSRSALSMKESLTEISSQRAEQFLNTFYFQYGHRSIADLAHIPFAIEKLSLLAAITVVDESRWDGQERSTRYQDFRRSGWFTPQLAEQQREAYTAAVKSLFGSYDLLGQHMLGALKGAIQCPETMKPESYERTLKARAFDVARYLLPLATNTSLGQIVNARTLESQVSRLLSSEFAEIRDLGGKLRAAASEPAWNVQRAALEEMAGEGSVPQEATREILEDFLRPVRTAPTLVKYAERSEYVCSSRAELAEAARELMKGAEIYPAPVVDLLDDDEDLEVEIATSLLYPQCHYSYRQLRGAVTALGEVRRREILKLGAAHRGRHDELLRAFSAGHGFRFDILMDIGGFRDMHRHRRCIQLMQQFSDCHGYDEPGCPGQPSLAEAGLEQEYAAAMAAAYNAYRALRDSGEPDAAQNAQYLLPLGTRCRSLFKMDFAEALYIAELRSGVAGHFSYRRVAWEMYRAVEARHPALAGLFRIEDVNVPVDLLKR